VGLNDENRQPSKKKGFFSKFGDSDSNPAAPTTSKFSLTGRKRGQSGQGAELGNMDRPGTSGSKGAEVVS
jgi:hypothetical protein